MAKTSVTLDTSRGVDPFVTPTGASKRTRVRAFRQILKAMLTGERQDHPSITYGTALATGTLTIASGSGTVGGTINGVGVTVTWGTSDTATAAALATAINASGNALVANHVTATSAAGVVTLSAKKKGAAGNAITLAASGTGVTASGARLTGGTESTMTF